MKDCCVANLEPDLTVTANLLTWQNFNIKIEERRKRQSGETNFQHKLLTVHYRRRLSMNIVLINVVKGLKMQKTISCFITKLPNLFTE